MILFIYCARQPARRLMATNSDIELLNKGVREWNTYWDPGSRKIGRMAPAASGSSLYVPRNWSAIRSTRRLRNPDLSGADLSGRNLAGINLQGADLRNANLANTNLYRANLWFANLSGANLRKVVLDEAQIADVDATNAQFAEASLTNMLVARTNLSEADLSDANVFNTLFIEVKLTNTLMRRTHMVQARFEETIFEGTDLSGATIGRNFFGDCTFRGVVGLSGCEYRFKSYLEPMTIARSEKFPLEFYRGCGWPDELILSIPPLLVKPFQLTSCFISYSKEDDELARLLHRDLSTSGVRCWFAPESLKVGDRFRSTIDESITQQERLLLILSGASIASRWVEKEVETALELEATQDRSILVPICVDDEVFKASKGWAADIRRTRHIGDFRAWREPEGYRASLDRLLRDLAR